MIDNEQHNLYKLNDLSNTEVVNILRDGFDSIPVINFRGMEKNYLYAFRDTPGNLFRILEEGRYATGGYYILTDKENNFKSSSGWYLYQDETEGEVAIVFTRSVTHPKYRNVGLDHLGKDSDSLFDANKIGLIKHYLFESIMQDMVKKHQGKIWATVNEKNRGFVWKAIRQGRQKLTQWGNDLDLEGFKYKHVYLGKRFIHYTWQHVIEFQSIED